MQRTIIIGDIHSCAVELQELLDKIEFQKGKDFLLFIGDLIGKGPYPLETFLIYKKTGATCIMGNAELAFLKNQQNPSFLKEYIETTKKTMGKVYQEFIEEAFNFPHFIETENYLAVHAGLLPHKKPYEMDLENLTKLRTIAHPQQPSQRQAWFESYHDKKLIVFGHWAALQGVFRDNVIGIDTGAVYGHKLTALILPSKTLVQVQSKKIYLAIT